MPTTDQILQLLTGYGMILAGGLVVAAALRFIGRWPGLFPLHRLRFIPWQGQAVIFAIVLSMVLHLGTFKFLELIGFYQEFQIADATDTLKFLWSTPISFLLFLGLLFSTLAVLSRARPTDLGLGLARWKANLVLGVLAFALLTPITQGLQVSLLYFVKANQNQLISIRPELDTWYEWSLLIFGAVIVAPVMEEILYRGLLLSWLRKATLPGQWALIAVVWIVGFGAAFTQKAPEVQNPPEAQNPPQMDSMQVHPDRMIFVMGLLAGYFVMLQRLREPDLFKTPEDCGVRPEPTFSTNGQHEGPLPEDAAFNAEARWLVQDRKQQWAKRNLAIYGSSMLWAVVHLPAWPDPVPLFILGLGLGWITTRSQSLWPSIVCHALFNFLACYEMFQLPG